MDVSVGHDPAAFAARAGLFLASEPFTANVLSVRLAAVLEGRSTASPEDCWILVEDDGRVIGAAMRTPPYNLFLPRLPPGAARLIATELSRSGLDFPGVNGVVESTREFAAAWQESTGQGSEVVTAMRLYVLGELREPVGVSGEARLATESEAGLVASWGRAFADEALRHETGYDEESDRRRLGAGHYHLWTDRDEPVALAGCSPAAAGVARVGPVYTPPEKRGRGYGSALTAHVSALALKDKAEHVVLYADVSNPVSNRIYQSIGFRADHDAEERTLGALSQRISRSSPE